MPDNQDPIEKSLEEKDLESKAAEALKIAKELEDKVRASKPVEEEVPDVDPADLLHSPEFRAKAKEATGMTDAQIDFVVKTAAAASANSNSSTAIEKVAAAHPADFGRYRTAIEKELQKYPAEKRGNKEIIEKLYYVEKGKDSEKNNGRNNSRSNIRSNGPTNTGLNNDDNNHTSELSDDERRVARKYGMSDKEYQDVKGEKQIDKLAPLYGRK